MAKEPDRLPRETAKSYAAFIEFVRLGPQRNLRKVAEKVGKSPDSVEKLSSQFKWYDRVKEYDAQVQKEDQEAMDLFRQQQRARQQRFEIERQEMMRQMALSAARRVQELLDSRARLTKTKTKDGVEEVQFVNTFPLMHVSLLMREANRVALSAVTDAFTEAEARVKGVRPGEREGDGVISSRIAGNFSVGDRMFDGSQPPPLPETTNPIPDQPTEKPLVDLTGTPYEESASEPK